MQTDYKRVWLYAPKSAYWSYEDDQIDEEFVTWCEENDLPLGCTGHFTWWVQIPDDAMFALFKLRWPCPDPVWGFPQIRYWGWSMDQSRIDEINRNLVKF